MCVCVCACVCVFEREREREREREIKKESVGEIVRLISIFQGFLETYSKYLFLYT